METYNIKCFVKAKAPVNIAVIKYWGKSNERLKIPLNDSLSGTLSIEDMCTTTSVYLSDEFERDMLVLNGHEQDLTSDMSPAKLMIEDIRKSSKLGFSGAWAKIVSENNFPTAAGLASSAAGYACLAFALGHAYGITDTSQLSKIARRGSGSACRSLFGGFVHWVRGVDHDTSVARQVVDHLHWPSMRVIICVINDSQKDVPSSSGMARSVETSALIKYRADSIVPKRIDSIRQAILDKDFESFANITMQDSNQFHAICLDTLPPIIYLNETSRQIIKICSIINEFYGQNKVAYTFDAGPNACIYLLDEFVPELVEVFNHFFSNDSLEIKGRPHDHKIKDQEKFHLLMDKICSKVVKSPGDIKYLISTSIGGGPELLKIQRK